MTWERVTSGLPWVILGASAVFSLAGLTLLTQVPSAAIWLRGTA